MTLISERLSAAMGVWHDGPRSFPVDRSEIRRWAIATHWPEQTPPLYWDDDYADTTRWGGIVAPDDFNPFAWAVTSPDFQPYHLFGAQPGEQGQQVLNGGVEFSFDQPIRPGDVITLRWRIKDAVEREGRFGEMLYIRIERELRNQREERVRTRIDTIIRY